MRCALDESRVTFAPRCWTQGSSALGTPNLHEVAGGGGGALPPAGQAERAQVGEGGRGTQGQEGSRACPVVLRLRQPEGRLGFPSQPSQGVPNSLIPLLAPEQARGPSRGLTLH